ncbi:hypothetical protein V757_03265 [Pelistega indica]|uniref:Uncharacterized protein n=1 Tax=Pelistega indica TaxID=1414851 RepID=V8GA94_9BURK|nr:hypothetical protein [Pelistega indica]ETD72607.1 hypothetical protein V757_03265 [Pelistega indica]
MKTLQLKFTFDATCVNDLLRQTQTIMPTIIRLIQGITPTWADDIVVYSRSTDGKHLAIHPLSLYLQS